MKVCARCKEEKPLSEFFPDPRYTLGVQSYCKKCSTDHNRERIAKNRQAFLDNQKAWYAKNKKSHLDRNRRHRKKIRDAVLALYGGKCACCDEHRYEFLSIDHRYGGGTQERKIISSEKLYRRLAKLEAPDERYRLLCHNCNFSHGHYGYCPHELTVKEDTLEQQ